MISVKQTIPFGLLSCLALLGSIKADDSTNNTSWPDWVTNDYDCVIGCLSGFNDTITSVPQDALAQQAFDCTSSTCTGDATGNYYQTFYYIQLFYATGSIYESSDSAPDGYKHAAFTDSTDTTSEAAVSGDWGDDDTVDPTEDIAASDSASATDSAETTGSADGVDGGSATDTAAVAIDTGTENGTVVTGTAADSTASGSKLSSASHTSSQSDASTASSNVAADISESGAFKTIGGDVAQRIFGAVGAMVFGGLWIGL
ncbi:hypothetical protein CNBH0680 [Cryptococcus deneoformans B-3501A]|uniref:hypothetical protein n=1 Tax=Cryptococcus deneoformans (strain B-3501A) TaxID=283643 RepID=UPI000042C217|nr:hypothetical protein CNBH0680 [Cryptococcus neoformans var. neoformans B-3501A]EAL19374.1 hypothetical protein CNBH0680 [Cryptococcus neoformans var. neoformans B-3501A]